MNLSIYKPDQGYWTRTMSALAIGVIGLAGAAWLWQQLSVFNNEYIQATGAVTLLLVLAVVTYYFYGAHRQTVEFFIATEGEMKKVNWSTRREIVGSTWVVVIVSVSIAIILFVVDVLFSSFFKQVGVLHS
ncbi:MAG: preprotein translocase subunit SecE [Phycisphaerales bacterium]